jgi:hypothetical protein
MKSMIGFIDPPGRYSASTKQWQEFLDRMLKLPQDEPQVQAAIREAKRVLERRQSAG